MTAETEAAIREFIASAEGWTQVDKALEMAQLILDTGADACLEIGVFAGGSLIPQALALREQGHGMIVGVDPWRKEAALAGENEANREWWSTKVDLEQMHRLTMEAIWRYHLESHIVIVRAASSEFANILSPHFFGSLDLTLDIANIDGNHSEEASCRDVALWLPDVAHGGYVWFDDADWPSTQKAVSRIDQQCELVRDHGTYRLYQKK